MTDRRDHNDDDDTSKPEVDARFDDSRPQFRKIKAAETKLVLDDERFSAVLTDPRFQLPSASSSSSRKKRGGGRKHDGNNKAVIAARERLSDFYVLQDHDDGKQMDAGTAAARDKTKKKKKSKVRDQKNENDEEDDDRCSTVKRKQSKQEIAKKSESRISHLMALARGEIDVSSSSSDDDDDDEDGESGASSSDDDDDASEEEEAEFVPGVLDPSSHVEDEPTLTNEPSPYLAIMNLEWTSVRAVDIFAVVASFVPPGSIVRVRVFPSDFGLEQMEKEGLTGPTSIWKRNKRPSNTAEDESGADDEVESEEEAGEDTTKDIKYEEPAEFVESDFNPEKLRAYEVSKLKYYFGIVEFSHAKHADIAYQQVDGMEFEHSSAAVDMRSIAVNDLNDVIQNRPVRDECTSVPSNYEPPEFVVSALQQSNVDCTWDVGDRDRERLLTKYTAGEAWKELAEEGQLDEYLASDVSSAESSDEEGEKAQNMRKLLGLEDDGMDDGSTGKAPRPESDTDEEEDEPEVEGDEKEVKFIPKAAVAKDDKQVDENDGKSKLSPWEKYKEKRKQKKREKRQVVKERRKQIGEQRKGTPSTTTNIEDPFFMDADNRVEDTEESFAPKQSKSDLELLAAEDDPEADNDYNMRAIQRAEKIKGKKLKGKRKKKEEETCAAAASDTFQVDTKDDRFRAVLDGTDSRFGIDPTDPSFKETTGMRNILTEQRKRRKEKKRNIDESPTGAAESSSALDSLVKKLKKKAKK